ncbi:MAG: heme-binding protein [Pirellulales bacterium]
MLLNRIRYALCSAMLLAAAGPSFAERATPVSSIRVRDGFKATLLRSAQAGESSWISMTFDDRRRIILGLDDIGIARLTLPEDGTKIRFERINNSLKHCRGVLFAHDSLYVSATNTHALYRLRDTNGDDRFDDSALLKKLDYRSRYGHGSNQIVLGPDRQIYWVIGNDVSFPKGVSQNSPYRDQRNDWLLPFSADEGHDRRVGFILRSDPRGKQWEVISGGLRNQVDLAFNRDGEMFTYDADMELDVGMPWYRPNRLIHVVSGADYGWRWQTGKWPAYYADSLPAILDTGLGSPTGLTFGTKSSFPPVYQRGLFMADWQNGRILLVHMQPTGASYRCEYELFLEGGPLNVCDMQFGPDGALYFITGGRGSQSGLYRVNYVGAINGDELAEATERPAEEPSSAARRLRQKLEAFHTSIDPAAIDFAWPHLGSPDNWIRHAARLAIERQPVERWRQRALNEKAPVARITALIALARSGSADDQQALLESLAQLPLARLGRQQLLALLRTYALTFIRQGPPPSRSAAGIAKRLDGLYPHENASVNRELCELLVYLRSPRAIEKTLGLMKPTASQEDQIHHAKTLSQTKHGWTSVTRRQLLLWLITARQFRGRSLSDIMGHIRRNILETMTAEEQEEFKQEIAILTRPLKKPDSVPPLPIVHRWTMADLLPGLAQADQRSQNSGRRAVAAAQCLQCHRIGDEGGLVGPDLTNAAKRFDTRGLLESIIEPSKVVDPKYRHTVYELANGQIVSGRPVGVSARKIVIETDPLTGTKTAVPRDKIESSQLSAISPMPTGLIDVLTKEEILDLLAYLKSVAAAEDDPALNTR